jgi:hypothetical protein
MNYSNLNSQKERAYKAYRLRKASQRIDLKYLCSFETSNEIKAKAQKIVIELRARAEKLQHQNPYLWDDYGVNYNGLRNMG